MGSQPSHNYPHRQHSVPISNYAFRPGQQMMPNRAMTQVVYQPPSRAAQIPPPQQSSQPQVIQNEMSIKNVSFKGSHDKSHISFIVDSLVPMTINIYAICQEVEVPVTRMLLKIQNATYEEEQQFGESVKNQSYTTKFALNLNSIQEKNLTNQGNNWPLIIKLESSTKLVQMIYYYVVHDHSLHKEKQKYQCQKGVFFIDEIYGIDNTELIGGKHDSVDQETCVICCDNALDTVIMPCRHMCICNECAQAIQLKLLELQQQPLNAQRQQQSNPNTCPICRKDIQSFIRLKKIN